MENKIAEIRIDGNVSEGIITKELSVSYNDLKITLNGKKYDFQYDVRHDYKNAKEGKWVSGYLITQKNGKQEVTDCQLRYKKIDNTTNK